MGSRAVRWRILFTAPSPSITTRLSIGATWAVAGIQSANNNDRQRTATLRAPLWRFSMGNSNDLLLRQDPFHGLGERLRDEIGRVLGSALSISAVQQHGAYRSEEHTS